MQINTHLPSSLIQKNDSLSKIFSQNSEHGIHRYGPKNFNDVGAYLVSTNAAEKEPGLEFANNIAAFKDMISTAQDTLSLIQAQGDSIYSLIQRAHSGECSEEELGQINSDIAAKISEINQLYQSSQFMGVNPFSEKFGISIPNWQDLIPVTKPEETEDVQEGEGTEKNENKITNPITSISFDCDISAVIDGATVNMTASATIDIGFTEDGALQMAVDASLDYDLSGIVKNGADSNEAMDIINKFLNLLTGKQNDLGIASNFLDGIYNNSLTIGEWSDYFQGLNLVETDEDSSSYIKGQIVQQAKITLDSSANQIPSIAINLL